jgi:hypothetical protein
MCPSRDSSKLESAEVFGWLPAQQRVRLFSVDGCGPVVITTIYNRLICCFPPRYLLHCYGACAPTPILFLCLESLPLCIKMPHGRVHREGLQPCSLLPCVRGRHYGGRRIQLPLAINICGLNSVPRGKRYLVAIVEGLVDMQCGG